jgi:hypothetical protein
MKGVPGLKWADTKTYGPGVDLGRWSGVVGRSDEVPELPEGFTMTPGNTDEAPAEVAGDDE